MLIPTRRCFAGIGGNYGVAGVGLDASFAEVMFLTFELQVIDAEPSSRRGGDENRLQPGQRADGVSADQSTAPRDAREVDLRPRIRPRSGGGQDRAAQDVVGDGRPSGVLRRRSDNWRRYLNRRQWWQVVLLPVQLVWSPRSRSDGLGDVEPDGGVIAFEVKSPSPPPAG